MIKVKRAIFIISFIISLVITSLIFIVLFKEISSIPTLHLHTANFEINQNEFFLHDYWQDLIRKYTCETTKFDKNGMPILKIKENYYYHPVYISQFALGAYTYYKSKNSIKAKKDFLKCADWLTENLKRHGKFFYWEYNFKLEDFPGVNTVPWFSAMAQGEGVSVLLRAYYETKNKKYLEAAKKGIEPIFHNVSDGGCSIIEENKFVLPQEYITKPQSNVLNGAISTYISVYEYYRFTSDQKVRKFCEMVEKTLSDNIEKYDTGYWSLYSLSPKYLADGHYNSLHVKQLKVLYLITGNQKFLIYSEKFRGYQNNFQNRIYYVLMNHLRQLREFNFKDVSKIALYLKLYL